MPNRDSRFHSTFVHLHTFARGKLAAMARAKFQRFNEREESGDQLEQHRKRRLESTHAGNERSDSRNLERSRFCFQPG